MVGRSMTGPVAVDVAFFWDAVPEGPRAIAGVADIVDGRTFQHVLRGAAMDDDAAVGRVAPASPGVPSGRR